jgi:hypothetical protein
MKYVHSINKNENAQIMQYKYPFVWFSYKNHNRNSKISLFANGATLHYLLVMGMDDFDKNERFISNSNINLFHI